MLNAPFVHVHTYMCITVACGKVHIITQAGFNSVANSIHTMTLNVNLYILFEYLFSYSLECVRSAAL